MAQSEKPGGMVMSRNYPSICLFLFLSLFGMQNVYAENSAELPESANDESTSQVKPAGDIPYYQILLRKLSKSKSVRSPSVSVHPVSALYNREAIIPPMCYTKTEAKYNPCYVCHQDALPGRENKMNDGVLQSAYSFSEEGMKNHWKNLFEDRTARVSAINDAEIIAWTEQDNYSELRSRLKKIKFKGWIPDLKNLQEGPDAFYANGMAKDGSHWVAFNYKPFPSTFWPTNGSTDDTMIRLDQLFRTDKNGQYDEDIYYTNLAIVEANLKNLSSISVAPVDERKIGVDLNKDGELSIVSTIKKQEHYVGSAEKQFMLPGVYPAKTEFLHTVRYVGLNDNNSIKNSRRMKEVRYMKKWVAHPLVSLREFYREEGYEKDEGYLPGYTNVHDHGLDNGMGWSIQGFIEDAKGRLRTYTYEENFACMGCHNSIGSTIDKTFSFPRKVDGAEGWGYINLKGMADVPNRGETDGEFLTYFRRARGGDEFRSNPEMLERWFNPDGSVNTEKIVMTKDIYELITPSRSRALALNKAYKVIVEDQDFIFGRDATVTSPKNVYQKIDNKTAPTLPQSKVYKWDIRLDW